MNKTADPNGSRNASAQSAATEPVAFIAHEIRTPLSAMLSLSNLLGKTPLDDTQQHYVQSLKSATTGLLAVLNDLLDHKKLLAGEFELTSEPFNPAAVIQEIATLFTPACQEKNLELVCTASEQAHKPIIGDPHRLRQILTNFVSNAVKFTETGTVALRLETNSYDGQTTRLTFSVEDTGVGIPESAQANLFKPFAQADASTATQYGGTGLGLAISAKLAELMGGEISFKSQEDLGSVFQIQMTCTNSTDAALAQHTDKNDGAFDETATGSGGLDQAKILVAEDNRINRTLISTYLDRFGCGFEFADSGKQALALMEKYDFDIILMDIYMPQMTGIEALNAVRALPSPKNDIPILALSADNAKQVEQEYLEKGFDGYVPKPIKPDVLYQRLCEMIGVRDRRASARG